MSADSLIQLFNIFYHFLKFEKILDYLYYLNTHCFQVTVFKKG